MLLNLNVFFVVILFFICNNCHKLYFHRNYTSIVINNFNFDEKERVKASFIIKMLIIITGVVLLRKITNFTASDVSNGFLIGSFLTVWPAIVYFKLLRPPFAKYKALILLRYILYIILVYSAVKFTQELILPSINGEEQYILDNSGIGIIMSLVLMITAPTLDYFITDICHFNNASYNFNLLKEEIEVSSRQFDIDIYYIQRLYKYEIEKYSREYNINSRLIEVILTLESMHRGELIRKIGEKIGCKYFYFLVVNQDMSIGVSQMKISTISRVLKTSPYNFKRKITSTKFLIRVTCRYLKEILEEYEFNREYEKKRGIDDVYEYIAESYTGSAKNKSGKVYSIILKKNLKNWGELNEFNESVG